MNWLSVPVAIALLAGFILGQLLNLTRRRLMLEALYGLILTVQRAPGWPTAQDVFLHLRERPWSPRSLAQALVHLEGMGLVQGAEGDPTQPGRLEARRFWCPALPLPGAHR